MPLRPFQAEALSSSLKRYQQGVFRQLLALPTGTGKTPTFAMLKQHHNLPGKVLVLVPREELAAQAADKLAKWNPGARIGIEMASSYADHRNDEYVVASIYTLGRKGSGEDEFSNRLLRFNPDEFSAVVVDEAHHSVAESYKRFFHYFGFDNADNKKLLLGVTATPNRGDGQALGQVYDQIVYEMSIEDAVKQGWLVDPLGLRIRTTTSLDDVHVRAGDLAQNELQDAVNTVERNRLVIRGYLDHGQGRKMIGFAVDIAHAKALAAEARAAGIAAEAVWGVDPDREAKLRKHKEGRFLLLFNSMVLTEGYDDPSLGGIIMARPTKSPLLYTQMIGRALRLPEGVDNLLEALAAGASDIKRNALILDVADNSAKHSLVSLSSLMGLPADMDLQGQSAIGAITTLADKQAEYPDLDLSKAKSLSDLEKIVEHVNLFELKWDDNVVQHSQLQWHRSSDGSFVLVMPKSRETVVVFEDLLGKWNVAGTVEGQLVQQSGFSSLQPAFRFADDMVNIWGNHLKTLLRREAPWHKDPATPLQRTKLRKLGINFPPNITKGQAQMMIGRVLFKPRKA